MLLIPTPPNFNFRRTALSHGWSDLPPFALDRANWRLHYTLAMPHALPVTLTLMDAGDGVGVTASRPLSDAEIKRVRQTVRHILRLDEDLGGFYAQTASLSGWEWVAREGAGRLLRGATVWEDLVKTICTTNCSWALTKKMVAGLVTLGEADAGGNRTFPTPQVLATQSLEFFRETVRAGYRAAYLKELAEKVASGTLDLDGWHSSPLPADKLKREMKRIKGVGDYAAEHLMKLIGRYDGLTLDSWVRGEFYALHNGGVTCEDKVIAAYYERFGTWRGLALWCDVTRCWLDDAAPAAS